MIITVVNGTLEKNSRNWLYGDFKITVHTLDGRSVKNIESVRDGVEDIARTSIRWRSHQFRVSLNPSSVQISCHLTPFDYFLWGYSQ